MTKCYDNSGTTASKYEIPMPSVVCIIMIARSTGIKNVTLHYLFLPQKITSFQFINSLFTIGAISATLLYFEMNEKIAPPSKLLDGLFTCLNK